MTGSGAGAGKQVAALLAGRSLAQWLVHIESVHFRSIDMTLERVAEVIGRMGLSRPAPKVITIGGTNGKGSTVAIVDAIARAAGIRTGAYTSPHLVHYGERVCIDGSPSDERALCAAFAAVEAARGDIPLTYFEFGTVAAFHEFARVGVDLAILEVGMGGRLDAVNAIDADASVVVSIGIDHVEWLGGDRERIGYEKAGIFRPGRPAICGDADPPASIIDHARRIGACLWRIGEDFAFEPANNGRWRYRGPAGLFEDLPPPAIPGGHQHANAACALAALEAAGLETPVQGNAAAQGLRDVRLRGRLETVGHRPLRIVDVAHNAQALATLRDYLLAHPVAGSTRIVLGMLRDKPVEQAVAMLGDLADGWYVSGLPGERGSDAASTAARLAGAGGPVYPCASVVEAWGRACADSAPDDRVVGVGSFITAGDIIGSLDAASAA